VISAFLTVQMFVFWSIARVLRCVPQAPAWSVLCVLHLWRSFAGAVVPAVHALEIIAAWPRQVCALLRGQPGGCHGGRADRVDAGLISVVHAQRRAAESRPTRGRQRCQLAPASCCLPIRLATFSDLAVLNFSSWTHRRSTARFHRYFARARLLLPETSTRSPSSAPVSYLPHWIRPQT